MSSMPIATQPTLYRIHPASFRDGNGDGVGDAHGMLAALPYLKALSIDGLLLPQTLAPEAETAVTGEGLTLCTPTKPIAFVMPPTCSGSSTARWRST